ncbi:DegV family protein [Clostridium sp. A1-XYC3]|uniref:DegV family protein n=1 Tax=Clostridium tanneri TaxID=3037988 RepID=A0ABU4JV56_9CLOT|nr:DegV family protein [Clostridium sp. A1-XYC3]MDW8801991.1 DegV family protein [Clostridium sp. A1-XYC3]
MKDFTIITDSCCDLPITSISELNIPYVSLSYHYNEIERLDDFGTSYSLKNFYDDMRSGAVPKTSQPSSHLFCQAFKKILDEGKDILYIGASSGLSGTVNGANIAKDMLEQDYPDYNIYILDILTASLGQGLMVLKAKEMQNEGKSIEEIFNYLLAIRQNLNTYMIVDDINHVKRGGRISSAAAFVGMLLNIKPFLSISDSGKVVALDKIRGRKRAINALFEKILEKIENAEDQIIAISHGDCIEDALALKRLILSKIPVKDVLISFIGPVVGTHGGPGAIAVFFLGKERELHRES